jgi:hypothetical protein
MPGGVARDGWYPIGIGRTKLLREGVAATAELEQIVSMDDENSFGNAQYDVTINVRPAGGQPYDVQGLFRVPVRLLSRIDPPLTVPVKVHPTKPKRVAIDWDAWEANAPSSP